MERAEVNTLTGSILIRYRAGATDGESLMASIRETGGNDNWVDRAALTALPGPAGRSREISPKGQKLAKLILRSVAQVAVERSFSALIAAIF